MTNKDKTSAIARQKQRITGIFDRAAPRQQRIFHVVYWAPGDTERYANFYMDRLGFRLTESIIKRIEMDTPYRIGPRSTADALLRGEILRVENRL